MSLQRVRQVYAKNRWLRWQTWLTVALVANGIRLIVTWPGPKTWWSDLAAPMLLVPFLACMAMALRLSDAQRRRREAAAAEAADLRTPRVPDAGPDECPVCGGVGLDELANDDKLMERGADRAQVVPWGRKRAHWACAEFVPYEPTKAGREAEVHRLAHFDGHYEPDCTHCRAAEHVWELRHRQRKRDDGEQRGPAIAFEVDGHPTYTGPASMERALRLVKGAAAGSGTILVNGAAPGTLFLLQDAALRHMEIVMIAVVGGGSRSGFGVSVTLGAPLRHSFAEGTQLLPFGGAEQLWNREAGRPYTRTELGLCDCRPEGKLRASLNAPQGRPCGFTAHIQELPIEPRWAHACVCDDCMAAVAQPPTRSAVKAARPSWMSASEARVLADIEEARLAPCRPPRAVAEGRWLWPAPKTLRRRP